ncbi:ketoacyl-ACP synthase III [candidate division WOR-3 bacterium]|nr:ketoacyl-ACP synthase III [candidate division WOR-3 bacterium]MCK4526664.1 ketoacyl-ACP synthase III [candidate division WOR-3 bacterium]
MFKVKITGTGSYLPEKVLTNFDLEKVMDTSDEWIRTRTGIRERHIAADDEATSDMVAKAAKKAIESAGITPKDIDLIMVATVTPDNAFPATACWVQKHLGIDAEIPAFDIGAACSGYLYGLIVSAGMIEAGLANRILLCGAEALTKITNWDDRSTCILFGDGAGCTVVEKSDGDSAILSHYWGADGRLGDLLIQPAGGSRMPASHKTVDENLHTVTMAGNDVYRYAVSKMKESAVEALKKANLTGADVDLYIPHQANVRIIEATIKRAGIPMEKTCVTIDHIANISAATVPISLDEAVREGRLNRNDILLLTVFGGGFTWGGIVLKW